MDRLTIESYLLQVNLDKGCSDRFKLKGENMGMFTESFDDEREELQKEIKELKEIIDVKNKCIVILQEFSESLKCCGNCRHIEYGHGEQMEKEGCLNTFEVCKNWGAK